MSERRLYCRRQMRYCGLRFLEMVRPRGAFFYSRQDRVQMAMQWVALARTWREMSERGTQ